VIPYTDAAWEAYRSQRVAEMAELNRSARARRRESDDFWTTRHETALAWLAATPEVPAPHLPPVVGLLGHAKLSHHLRHGLPSGQLDLGLAELPDDLLRCELLSSWHRMPSLGLKHPEILSLKVVTFKGGRSRPRNPFEGSV
jgi:hypothetical protein